MGSQFVLPVKLYFFVGRTNGPDAILAWQTAAEYENQLFDVERSVDGRHFERVGTLPGAGTTVVPQRYGFTDPGVTQLKETGCTTNCASLTGTGAQRFQRS